MPLYEYECPACKRSFEELVRNAVDEQSVACPACGQKNVVRLLSTTAPQGAGESEGVPSGACSARGGFS